MLTSRADLHVHSKYSDRPSEWILRRLGAPECYTPPAAVYATARRRGMQFVTISDHNCINGALEIAHLPGAFVSVEVTTYFPSDGCKVHVLCWNVTEAQFADIQRLRRNIVELRDYLQAERIVHSCAHPLYDINDRLTVDHFEELLLLFNVFETMNGSRNRRGNEVMLGILEGLTREQFEMIAARHRIAPVGDRPWIKGFTGGSDDHSGIFIAKGHTVCPASRTATEFLNHVFERRGIAGGLDGTPLSFAHSLYSIGYRYYRDRFLSKSSGGDLMLRLLSELLVPEPAPAALKDRLSYYARRLAGTPARRAEVEFRRLISTEMIRLFGEDWMADDFVVSAARHEELNRRTFELSSHVANQLLFQFSKKLVEKVASGSLFGALEAVSAAGPILLGIGPYMFSFTHQNRDKGFLDAVSGRLTGRPVLTDARPRKAWFVESAADVPGGLPALQEVCRLARIHEHDLTVIPVSDAAVDVPGRVRPFRPVGYLAWPEPSSLSLPFPPFLELLDYCDREQFTELIVSGPTLVGLAALATAKMLRLRIVGLCQPTFPQAVRNYTDDEAMESAAWRYLRWFYDQMDAVLVTSLAWREILVARGFDATKLRLFPCSETCQWENAYMGLWNGTGSLLVENPPTGRPQPVGLVEMTE